MSTSAATEYLTGKAEPTLAALPGPTIIVMKRAAAIGLCPGTVIMPVAVPSPYDKDTAICCRGHVVAGQICR